MSHALSLDIRPLLAGAGTLPMLVQAPEPGLDLMEALGELKPLVAEHLYRAGGILFRGFDVGGPEAFRELLLASAIRCSITNSVPRRAAT